MVGKELEWEKLLTLQGRSDVTQSRKDFVSQYYFFSKCVDQHITNQSFIFSRGFPHVLAFGILGIWYFCFCFPVSLHSCCLLVSEINATCSKRHLGRRPPIRVTTTVSNSWNCCRIKLFGYVQSV